MAIDRILDDAECAFIKHREAKGAKRHPWETNLGYLCRLYGEADRERMHGPQ